MPVDAVEDAWRVLELAARIVVQHGVLDCQRPGAAIDYEEDGAAALAGGVVAHDRAVDEHAVAVAVGIDRAAAAAAGGACLLRVLAEADSVVVEEEAVEDIPLGVDAAQGGAVGAMTASECVAGDVDGFALPHAQRADRPAAEVRAVLIAAVVDESGVDDFELAALGEDGAAAIVRGLGLLNG